MSVKHAIHSENICRLKTGLKMKFKYHAGYLHRSESHHHMYSLTAYIAASETIYQNYLPGKEAKRPLHNIHR